MSALSVLALACAVVGARGVRLQTSRVAPLVDARGAPPTRVAGALAPLVDAGAPPTQRPSLLPYNPLPAPGAVVVDSTGTARFTVLTPRLIRMEQASAPGAFEDRATIAFLNRNLPVPSFTHGEAGGVLTITTASVVLSYTVGQPFSRTTLTVASADPTSAFTSWRFGAAFPGNLLGTIRGLDEQSETSLNCTLNAGIDDNGEFNHCEWGLISRDGWAVVDDTPNYCLDANDWWSTTGSRKCGATFAGTDATDPTNSNAFPLGTTVASQADCCAACMSDPSCGAGYVWDTNAGQSPNCWPLAGMNGKTPSSQGRTLGLATNPTSNTDAVDLYGFFHGHDYYGAIADFVAVSGKTAMVPKYAAGVWWSRWYDLSNYDTTKIVDDYESRQIPLDVFVIDMDWHKKDDWSGFTFDSHLFPYPSDSMAFLKRKGLAITLNIHDASGVNSWEALFPELSSYLGLPANSTKVPFNLVNATVAYAVEDIVLGDLVYNKSIDFWWIDWQQGNYNGGVAGHKQNPTIWTDHLRCTDRHRNGDTTRAMVLARWGGLGGHRYQVGFTGDVASLSWANMAYQPYFSATAANVAHAFVSHDIEGPADDMELYTRWIQIGAFSGVMRSHDRGMSGGGCANDSPFSCSIVEPWNVPPPNFEANRAALQARETLLPYIYNGHRAAFDGGVGLIRPMYYDWPEEDAAYAMTAAGSAPGAIVQYMFGPSVLFSPVTTPAPPMLGGAPGVASKTTWLPPSAAGWYDANSGAVTYPGAGGAMVTKNYTLAEIPLFYRGGDVIPYLPLKSLPGVGLAIRQVSFLGLKIVPGGSGAGSTVVYEDDGVSTDYLDGTAKYVKTTASYTATPTGVVVTVGAAVGNGYAGFPATRAYQVKLLNGRPLASVTLNGVAVPFDRFGAAAATGAVPTSSAHYYAVEPAVMGGAGPVVNVVGVPTNAPATIAMTFAPETAGASLDAGVYGAISRAVAAKLVTDADRSTPGSNSPAPANLSVLSSTGDALAFLAGADPAGWAAAVAAVPTLLSAAISELLTTDGKSPRVPYAVTLLTGAST